MTIAEANKIFRTKYLDGEIVQRGCMGGACKSAVCVTYKTHGKVYYYNAQSYVELLNRLGFNVLYERDVLSMKKEIQRLEKIISDGGTKNIFTKGFQLLTEERKAEYLNTIHKYKTAIENSIVVNG